jgi:hypothetical protein
VREHSYELAHELASVLWRLREHALTFDEVDVRGDEVADLVGITVDELQGRGFDEADYLLDQLEWICLSVADATGLEQMVEDELGGC